MRAYTEYECSGTQNTDIASAAVHMIRVQAEQIRRMTVDEYETIRLIDLEGCTQEECAKRMHVARSTVQMIYNEARRKTADCLVNGKPLIIAGGNYRLCDGAGRCHAGKCPVRKECQAANIRKGN